jgi:hypothetical protein
MQSSRLVIGFVLDLRIQTGLSRLRKDFVTKGSIQHRMVRTWLIPAPKPRLANCGLVPVLDVARRGNSHWPGEGWGDRAVADRTGGHLPGLFGARIFDLPDEALVRDTLCEIERRMIAAFVENGNDRYLLVGRKVEDNIAAMRD